MRARGHQRQMSASVRQKEWLLLKHASINFDQRQPQLARSIHKDHFDGQNASRSGRGHRRYVLNLRRGIPDAGCRQMVGLPAFRLLPSRHMQQDWRLASA
jgi:hypothetical protein